MHTQKLSIYNMHLFLHYKAGAQILISWYSHMNMIGREKLPTFRVDFIDGYYKINNKTVILQVLVNNIIALSIKTNILPLCYETYFLL